MAMAEELVGVMGPVAYVVVEFPGNKMTGEGLEVLVDLVDRGVIRIIDLAFISKADDGSVLGIDLQDLDSDGELDLTIFEGASSGLLDEDDLVESGAVLAPGSSAAVLLYENRWAAPFVAALRRGGAELVAAGFIPLDDIAASLDAVDPTAN
jgi:hypothetical protein